MKYIIGFVIVAVIGGMALSKEFRETVIESSVSLKDKIVVLVVGEDGWGSEEDGWGGRERSMEEKTGINE